MKVSVIAIVVVGALLLAPTTSARTLKLNWVEQRTKAYYTSTPMTFKVKDVVLVSRNWSVHASFTNRSTAAIRIRPSLGNYFAPYNFGLGWSAGGGQQLDVVRYSFARPVFPKQLRPGQTWSGVFGGRGQLPNGLIINVIFGPFYPPTAPQTVKEFNWITSHAFKL